MRRMWSVCGSVMLALAGASIAYAARPAIDYARVMSLEDIRSMKEELKLTDDQIARYRALRDAYFEAIKEADTQEDAKQKELLDLVKAEQPNSATIDAKVKEILELERKQVESAVKLYTDFAKNLTKDQLPLFWGQAGKKFFKPEQPKQPKQPAEGTKGQQTQPTPGTEKPKKQ